MTALNVEWALRELEQFVDDSTEHLEDMPPGVIAISYKTRANNDVLTRNAVVVERILDRTIPAWREQLRNKSKYETRWQPLRDQALRAIEVLRRDTEVRANLGEDAPLISAASLHPWIWDGARSLWQSGHHREAVEGAVRKLNAETQNKLGRQDLGEVDLFKQAFSLDPADAGKPRLRRVPSDESKTYRSVQRGAIAFAEGIFAGIRNLLAHEANLDMSEQEALEYLAALSVLARWVDDSELEEV